MTTDESPRGTQPAGHRVRVLVHFAGGPAWTRDSKKAKRYAGKPAAFIGGCPPDALYVRAIDAAVKAGRAKFDVVPFVFVIPATAYERIAVRAGVLDAFILKAKAELERVRVRYAGVEVAPCRRCWVNLENMRLADEERVATYKRNGNWPLGDLVQRSLSRAESSGGSAAIRERSGKLERKTAAIGYKADPAASPDPRQVRADVRLAAAADRLERRIKADNRAKRKKAKR